MANPGKSVLTEQWHAELISGFSRLEDQTDERWPSLSRGRTIKPRQLISDRDPDGGFWLMVLTDGWAIRFRLLPDGRRQILKFLIPGDFLNICRLASKPDQDVIQTITECSLTEFRGEAAVEIAQSDTSLLCGVLRYHLAEVMRLQARLVDLGRRFAEERIARLVLELHGRLTERGLATEQTFYLPVRQEHLADALGMTPVHVSRTLRSLRDNDILTIDHGMLRIQNYARLSTIAGI